MDTTTIALALSKDLPEGEIFFRDYNPSMAPLGIVMLLFGILVLGICVFLSGAFSEKAHRVYRAGAVILGVLIAAGAVWGMFNQVTESNEKEARNEILRENRAAFVEDRGVYIPDSNWADLEFPIEEPTGDERFGIAQGEYQGRIVSVLLVWEDGELKLYSTEGDEIEPLSETER